MKRYLIDESTFKKFVAKVKASADGEKVTAIVNQSNNERFGIFVSLLTMNFEVNLRKYAAPRNENPPRPDPNQSPSTASESNQQQKLRSGRKFPDLNPNPSRKRSQLTSKTNKHDHPPSHPENQLPNHPQVPTTQTDSRVINQWKNLENPFSFSGNTATILDQIKSFS